MQTIATCVGCPALQCKHSIHVSARHQRSCLQSGLMQPALLSVYASLHGCIFICQCIVLLSACTADALTRCTCQQTASHCRKLVVRAHQGTVMPCPQCRPRWHGRRE